MSYVEATPLGWAHLLAGRFSLWAWHRPVDHDPDDW